MSRSPERISSYRRHFEDSSSSTYQVRVSSPSPTRRQVRHGSTGYSARAGSSSMCVDLVGRRTVSAARRSRVTGVSGSAGALVCVGPYGESAIDLDVAAAENQEFLNTRTSERQEMIVLNDRLAVYIDKVRSLEQKNKLLEAEIEAYQNRFEKPSGLRLLYEEQLKELKRIADQMKIQRDISVAAKDSAAAQLEAIKIKYEEAVELRKKAELDIETFRPDVDKATSSRIVLEKKLEQLEVEIEFFKRIHHQEIEELMKQIYSAHVSAQSAFTLPDLAGALKQIQTQYDDIAAKNLQEMDSWYKNKFEDLTKKSSRHVDKVRSIREEIAGAKKDIQSKERDLDSLKTRNEALEAQIREREEKYRKELGDLQARIEALQLELKSTKEKIALHLREYQDLLNIKMALEIEITTYRKLIEGEDLRLSGMMKSLSLTSCSMSVIGAGVSLSGGNMDAVGGMGGGLMGHSRGSAGGEGGGIGVGGGMVAGDIGSGPGSVGLGDRIGGGGKPPADWAAVAGMVGDQRLGAGGVGVGASTGAVGSGTSSGGGGAEGRSSVGAGGLEFGTSGSGTAVREVSVGGVGSGAGPLGTSSEGLDAVVKGLGAGSGTGPSGTGPGGLDAVVNGLGTGSGAGPSDAGVGLSSGSMVDGMAIGTGGNITGLAGSMGRPGAGFGEGNSGVGGGKNDKMSGEIGGHGSKVQGLGSTEMGGGIGGSAGTEGRSREDEGVALLDDGKGKIGRKGGMNGAKTEYGSNGCGGSTETYAEQAVELTERRTVIIRTVKTEDGVLEMDHHEQTYTITGAADDSDVE